MNNGPITDQGGQGATHAQGVLDGESIELDEERYDDDEFHDDEDGIGPLDEGNNNNRYFKICAFMFWKITNHYQFLNTYEIYKLHYYYLTFAQGDRDVYNTIFRHDA